MYSPLQNTAGSRFKAVVVAERLNFAHLSFCFRKSHIFTLKPIESKTQTWKTIIVTVWAVMLACFSLAKQHSNNFFAVFQTFVGFNRNTWFQQDGVKSDTLNGSLPDGGLETKSCWSPPKLHNQTNFVRLLFYFRTQEVTLFHPLSMGFQPVVLELLTENWYPDKTTNWAMGFFEGLSWIKEM